MRLIFLIWNRVLKVGYIYINWGWFLFKNVIHMLVWKAEVEWGKHIERSSICWLSPNGHNDCSLAHLKSPWLLHQAHSQGARLEYRQPGLELAPKLNASTIANGFTYYSSEANLRLLSLTVHSFPFTQEPFRGLVSSAISDYFFIKGLSQTLHPSLYSIISLFLKKMQTNTFASETGEQEGRELERLRWVDRSWKSEEKQILSAVSLCKYPQQSELDKSEARVRT